jgi:pyruvate formate lyase activating enzyme
MVTDARREFGVNRMAISGGEPTLNRRWLVEYFRELKRLNQDGEARLHLDSNGTCLSQEYIDELVDAGVTDIGIEPKGVCPETSMKIAGIPSYDLAKRWLSTSWRAIEYILTEYRDRVFLGVGLPYNRELISVDEVFEFGKRLSAIDPRVQLCVLDYFPAFRRRELKRPFPQEMLKVKSVLEDAGLRTVVVQTSKGHIGPGDDMNF